MSSPFAAAKVMASRAIAPPPIRVSRWRRAVIARLAPFAAVILALSVVAGPPGSAQEPPGPASLLQDPLAGLKPPAPPGAGAVPRLTVFCSAQDKAGFLALTAKRRADARAEFLSLLDYTSEVAKRTDAVDSLYTSGKITRDVWQSARRPLVAEHDQWNPELDRRRALFYGLDKLYNDAVNADVVDCEELSRREAEERTDEAIREWRHAFGRRERLQRAGAALTDLPEAERVGYADEIQSAIYQEASAAQDGRAVVLVLLNFSGCGRRTKTRTRPFRTRPNSRRKSRTPSSIPRRCPIPSPMIRPSSGRSSYRP